MDLGKRSTDSGATGAAHRLFYLLSLSNLLDCAPLLFDFLLLLGNLLVGLLLLGLLILQLMAYRQPAQGADTSANQRTAAGMPHRSADNCSSACAQHHAAHGTLFERRERLSVACNRHEHNRADR